MAEPTSTEARPTRAYVIHPDLGHARVQRRTPEHALAEAVALAHALPGIEIVGQEVARLRSPDAGRLFGKGKLAEIECLVVRRDLNGLLNFDLLFSRDYGEYVWESLLEAGGDLEVIPYGHEAMSLLGGSDHGGH